jgi:hypothetical protein
MCNAAQPISSDRLLLGWGSSSGYQSGRAGRTFVYHVACAAFGLAREARARLLCARLVDEHVELFRGPRVTALEPFALTW